MVPFYVKNHLNRHLGCHLASSKLPKDARVASLGFVMYYVSSFKKASADNGFDEISFKTLILLINSESFLRHIRCPFSLFVHEWDCLLSHASFDYL